MIEFSVKVSEQKLSAVITGFSKLLDDLSPTMKVIGEQLLANWTRHWRQETDPYGRKWAPLSDTTTQKRRKGKKSGSARILADTGRLQMSFIPIYPTKGVVSIGTEVEYAAVHQFGVRKGKLGIMSNKSPIPWGDIPMRPLLPWEEQLPGEDITTIDHIIADHLAKAEKG